MKLECLIADDEPNAGKLLEDYIRKVPNLVLKANCFDGMEALDYIRHEHVDLVFLDINMPNLSGMELMNVIPKGLRIIFTTAYSEYAIESYEYNVVDYLLKPITFKRFLKAITKAEELISQQSVKAIPAAAHPTEYMFVKSDKKMIRINFDEILFFEAVKEYICIHTDAKKILMYKRMKDLMEKLPDNFIRVHNSYIINCNYISRVEGNFALIGNHSIPLGSSYKDRFIEFIQSRAL